MAFGILAAVCARGDEAAGWARYELKLPGHVLEYKVPPVLQIGYGKRTTELEFDKLPADPSVFRLDQIAYQKPIITFWGKVRMGGLARPAEASFQLAVIIVDKSEPPIASSEQLADFLRRISGSKRKLKDGREVAISGSLQSTVLQGRDVFLITSSDMTRTHEYELPGPKGAILYVSPQHRFFLRLDDRILLCLTVKHYIEKHFNDQWYDKAISIAEDILKNLKFTPTDPS